MREIVGVLGGTFDPVHFGHLKVAEETLRAFALRRVLLVPCATPPHKEAREVTPAHHRVAMLELAVAERAPELEVSTLEIDRGGTSFTIDTLRALRATGVEPLFVLGRDALLEIATWRDHRSLVEDFDLVLVDRLAPRPEAERRELETPIAARLAPIPRGGLGGEQPRPATGVGGRIFLLPMEPLFVSSREVRERARTGRSLDGLVPPAVARYIQRERLYPTGG